MVNSITSFSVVLRFTEEEKREEEEEDEEEISMRACWDETLLS